jgi:multiple antibiotic resistance protein
MLKAETSIIDQFVLLWVVMEPVAVVSIFLGVTGEVPSKLRSLIAVKAVLVAGGVLLFFIVAGHFLLDALGVDLVAFQIAGSLILFLTAVSMIFGRLTATDPHPISAGTIGSDLAIFPLGIPTIAGPGAMLAVVLLTDNHRFSIGEQVVTVGVLAAVLLILLGMLVGAETLHRIIGPAGASIVTRVMGLLLAAIAVNSILEATSIYFKIAR